MLVKDVDRPVQTPHDPTGLGNLNSLDGHTDYDVEVTGDNETPGFVITDDGVEPNEEEKSEQQPQEFDGNLAESLDLATRGKIAQRVSELIEDDNRSRQDWIDNYKESLKYLGLKEEYRTMPWPDAAGVVHPGMLEGIVRFQSRALAKLFPARGPANISVKKRITLTPDIQLELERAQSEFNEYLMKEMPEVFKETDRMLFSLADIGFAAKKVFFHTGLVRTTSQFVKAENFIMPYGCDDLRTCERFTEEVRMSVLEAEQRQRDGVYLEDVTLQASLEEMNEVEDEKARITGQQPSSVNHDSLRIYESYIDMFIEDDEFGDEKRARPYKIVVEKDTDRLLAIYRNWDQIDESFQKKVIFVPYVYVPGEGSYSLGMVQLIGQISQSITKILRQLLDAGTLANIPGGFASRDARISGVGPIAPGEFRRVDIDAVDLSKAFFPLPFHEPSATLLQLMVMLIEEQKSFSSTADLDISAGSQNAPVGTTLALLEKNAEVTNAVQLRLHNSWGQELNLILSIIRERQPAVYDAIFVKFEQLVGGRENFSLVPSGDPTAATMSQRVIQLQAVQQMATQSPGVFDLPVLYRTIISALGIMDAEILVPDRSRMQPMGIVDEHMAFLTGKPVQAFPIQDQDSHIAAHEAILTDPLYAQLLGKNPQTAQLILSAIQAHISEHLAFQYRNQIEQQLGTQLPLIGEPQPPQVEASLSQLVAKAAQQVGQLHASQAQQKVAQQQAADPAYQLEQQELAIKKADIDGKHANKSRELDLRETDNNLKVALEVMRNLISANSAQKSHELKSNQADGEADRSNHDMAIKIAHRLMDHVEHGNQLEADQSAVVPPQQ